MAKLTPEQLLELADNFHDRVFSINQTQQLFDHIAALEAENARYKEALWEYADHNNWVTTHGCESCYDANDPHDWWQQDGDGWELAEKALKGDSNQ